MKNLHGGFLTKISHIFLLSALITVLLILGGYYYYNHSTNQLFLEEEKDLKAIADLKISQIVEWRKERTADAKVISGGPFFVDAIQKWLKDKNNKTLAQDIQLRLAVPQKEFDYEAISLASIEGEALLAVGSDLDQFDSITSEKIIEVAKKDKITFTNFYFCDSENKIHYDIIAPLVDELDETIAVLVFRSDPAKYIYPVIQTWPTPSKSAETLLFKKDGDSVLFLNELRFQKNTALKLRLPLTKKELPAVQSVLGRTGIFIGKDYRGVDVLSYLSSVPGTDWFMVAKVDSEEILSEINFLSAVVALFVILLILILTIGIVWIYQLRQKNLYKTLWEKQEETKTTLQSIGDAVITTDTNGKIKYLNPVAEKLTGWNESDAKEKLLKDVFKIINERSRIKVDNAVQKVIRKGVVAGLSNHTILISKDGNEMPIAESGGPIRNEAGKIVGVVLVFRDQTQERNAQKEILRLNRVYALLSNTNQAIVRVHDKQKLFNDICRIAIDDGKFKMAWIGMVDQAINAVDAAAASGVVVDYLEKMNIDLTDEIQSQCPMGRVIKTGMHFILNDIENDKAEMAWKINAFRLGYKAAAAFPIKVFGNTIGGFTFYSDEKEFFQTEEIKLLDEMSQDISFALEFIETDNKRKLSEETLKESERKFRTVIEEAAEVIFTTDVRGYFTYVNPAGLKASGYSLGELTKLRYTALIEPEYSDLVTKTYIEQYKNRTDSTTTEYLFRNKTGEKKWFNQNARLIIEKGEVTGFYVIARDVTERKQAEIALQENELRLRNIIEHSTNVFYAHDTNHVIQYMSPQVKDFLGYDVDEALIKWTEFSSNNPINKIGFQKTIKAIETGEVQDPYELELVHKNGNKVWVQIREAPVREGGKTISIVGSLTNITEQKIAGEKLRESEEKFRTLFNTTIEGICAADFNDKITLVNPRFAEMTGYSIEELSGMNFTELVSPDEVENHLTMKSERKRGESEIYERKLQKKDNSILWVMISASPLLSSNGEYQGSFGMFADITEKKRINEMMIKSESQLRSVWESSFDGMRLTNSEGKIIAVNDSFCKMVEKSRNELEGSFISSIQKEARKNHILKIHQKRFKDRDIVKYFEREIELWNGKTKWFGVSNSFVELGKNETLLLGIFRDITAKKKAEFELIEAKEKAEEMNKIKSNFFASMSHELRTPFVGIQGYAELLADTLTNPNDLEMVDAIINSSKRLTDTLDKILNLSKTEFKEAEVQISVVNVNDLLNECNKLYSNAAAKKHLSLTLYGIDKPLLIKSNEKLLRGIIENLIDNAIKYTPKGKIELRILITERGGKEYLKITVSDTGIGIPKDKQDLIWLAFRQVSEGLSRSYEGVGLGLTITKRYVEQLGGTISLESKPGNGSTFTIELPMDRTSS